MDMPKDFYDMVCADIERLSNTQNLSGDERLKLHREMDGKYQACIKKNGMRDYAVQTKEATIIWYQSLRMSPDSVQENLEMMKAKLETYKYQMNAVQLPKPEVSNSQIVNVTNSVNVNVTFEQVRKEVEEMTSLTNEQTQEVLDKISEIEEVVKSKDSKKSKWEKSKACFDVAGR